MEEKEYYLEDIPKENIKLKKDIELTWILPLVLCILSFVMAVVSSFVNGFSFGNNYRAIFAVSFKKCLYHWGYMAIISAIIGYILDTGNAIREFSKRYALKVNKKKIISFKIMYLLLAIAIVMGVSLMATKYYRMEDLKQSIVILALIAGIAFGVLVDLSGALSIFSYLSISRLIAALVVYILFIMGLSVEVLYIIESMQGVGGLALVLALLVVLAAGGGTGYLMDGKYGVIIFWD